MASVQIAVDRKLMVITDDIYPSKSSSNSNLALIKVDVRLSVTRIVSVLLQEVKLLYRPNSSCVIRRVKIGVVINPMLLVRKLAAVYQMPDFSAFTLLLELILLRFLQNSARRGPQRTAGLAAP